jgi:hypothetical protein
MGRKKGKKGRRRLASLSLPVTGGGIGWITEPGEFDVVRDLFSDLGGLRVLAFAMEAEGEEYVNQSILNIRDELSAALKRLPDGSASTANLRSMRMACNQYLGATPGPQGYQPLRPHFEDALWRWRQTIYEDVKALAYGLDLEEARLVMRAMHASFS